MFGGFRSLTRSGRPVGAVSTLCVMVGLDPAIHMLAAMGPRVKPEDDVESGEAPSMSVTVPPLENLKPWQGRR
ncbi:hypothetical protein AGR9A_Lc20222 [Agrobacterium salinitolerans str. Hayward 0363]|nr:hypothetical protein AGR9A_Lc20222 [Agrobacterium salinitolerans str. Hayward 0363]